MGPQGLARRGGLGWRLGLGILRSWPMRLPVIPALVLLLGACEGPSTRPDLQEGVRRALLAEELGDWRRAAELWHGLHDGASAQAARGLARALVATGDRPGALRVLAGVSVVTPGLLMDRAALHGALGQAEQAAEDLRVACRMDRASLEARTLLGQQLLEQGLDLEALGVLREAAALSPADPGAWRRFAVAAARAGAGEEELGAYLALAGLGPLQLSEALALAGLVVERPEHHGAAARWLAAALEQDPSRSDGWLALAGLRGRLGDADGRVAALRSALEAEPGDRSVLLELGRERAVRAEWEALEKLLGHAQSLEDQELVQQLEALLGARQARPAEGGGED